MTDPTPTEPVATATPAAAAPAPPAAAPARRSLALPLSFAATLLVGVLVGSGITWIAYDRDGGGRRDRYPSFEGRQMGPRQFGGPRGGDNFGGGPDGWPGGGPGGGPGFGGGRGPGSGSGDSQPLMPNQ